METVTGDCGSYQHLYPADRYCIGFLGTNLLVMLLMIAGLTIAVVVTGIYTGYHLGFEHKTKAYIAGAILLWIAGIDVIVRHILR